MSLKPKSFLVLLAVAAGLSGCIVGARHNRVSSQVVQHGQVGEVSGSASAVELGVAADFRYFRLSIPFEGVAVELVGRSDAGGYFGKKDNEEFRALRLDVPLVSLHDFNKGGMGYPGTMVHRHSLEVWASGAVDPRRSSYWWADLGLTYYRHNVVAVRIFGGYGRVPFREVMRGRNPDYSAVTQTWEGTSGGVSFGLDITLFAGEHALDLFQFFLDEDETVRGATPDR